MRQVGQVAPPLKQKIEQFQQIIDNNDQSVARIREQLRRLEPQRERLSDQVQQRQDDGRSIHSQLVRLEDSLASFGAESVQLEAAAEEMPRLLERIAVPVNGPGPGDPSFRRLPAAAIDVPLPYFDTLAEQLEARTKQAPPHLSTDTDASKSRTLENREAVDLALSYLSGILALQIYERVNAVEKALATYNRQAGNFAVPTKSLKQTC